MKNKEKQRQDDGTPRKKRKNNAKNKENQK